MRRLINQTRMQGGRILLISLSGLDREVKSFCKLVIRSHSCVSFTSFCQTIKTEIYTNNHNYTVHHVNYNVEMNMTEIKPNSRNIQTTLSFKYVL